MLKSAPNIDFFSSMNEAKQSNPNEFKSWYLDRNRIAFSTRNFAVNRMHPDAIHFYADPRLGVHASSLRIIIKENSFSHTANAAARGRHNAIDSTRVIYIYACYVYIEYTTQYMRRYACALRTVRYRARPWLGHIIHVNAV